MREVKVGDKEIRIKATPLTLLFYKQTFGSDLVGDLAGMEKMAIDPSKFDSIVFLQIFYAMAKTDSPSNFPSFDKWVIDLDGLDLYDTEMLEGVMYEAVDGFFRSANAGIAHKAGL